MQGATNAASSFGGHFVQPKKETYVNRTGAATVIGQFYMVDFLGTQSESTSITQGQEGSCQRNLTPCTQAGIDAGFPVVIALQAAADNTEVECLEYGYADAAILDDDVSTTDIDRGDAVAILVSESAVAAQAQAASASRSLGIALEDAAASTDGSATQIDASSHRRRILFWGGIAGQGANNA